MQEIATTHHNTAAWSDIFCSLTDHAAVLALATARHIAGNALQASPWPPRARAPRRGRRGSSHVGGLVDEDTPDMYPDLSEEEDDKPELPEHEVPEPEDANEEAPVPFLSRFLALHIVYGDGLRPIPTVG